MGTEGLATCTARQRAGRLNLPAGQLQEALLVSDQTHSHPPWWTASSHPDLLPWAPSVPLPVAWQQAARLVWLALHAANSALTKELQTVLWPRICTSSFPAALCTALSTRGCPLKLLITAAAAAGGRQSKHWQQTPGEIQHADASAVSKCTARELAS